MFSLVCENYSLPNSGLSLEIPQVEDAFFSTYRTASFIIKRRRNFQITFSDLVKLARVFALSLRREVLNSIFFPLVENTIRRTTSVLLSSQDVLRRALTVLNQSLLFLDTVHFLLSSDQGSFGLIVPR